MPFSGAGVFNRIYSWVTDAANGVFVSSSRMDTDTNDIAAGLSNCITKDGQTTVTADIPMAGFKITGLGLGTAANDAASVANLASIGPISTCEFRLTLTTGVPVTTADVTAATTIYCSPYKGYKIALYDGAAWNIRTSAEFSLALGTLTSGLPYDVFCYDNATVPTLEFLAWTNITTRATALVLQNGVLVKSGATTRRYLGTFCTTSTTQTEDSIANRFVWNYYNRVLRPMRVLEATDSWQYQTTTIRQARASTANQLNFVMGYGEDCVSADVAVSVASATVADNVAIGIGLDSTSTFTSGGIFTRTNLSVADRMYSARASLKVFPGVGKRFLSWNETGLTATGIVTWYGDNGAPTVTQSGIHGEIWG